MSEDKRHVDRIRHVRIRHVDRIRALKQKAYRKTDELFFVILEILRARESFRQNSDNNF